MGLFGKKNELSKYQNMYDVFYDKYIIHIRSHVDTLSNFIDILIQLAQIENDIAPDFLKALTNAENSKLEVIQSSIKVDVYECDSIPQGNEIKEFLGTFSAVCENLHSAYSALALFYEEGAQEHLQDAEALSNEVREILDQ